MQATTDAPDTYRPRRPPQRRLLRMGEVAERLDVRTGRAYELAREGRLPGVVRLGRQIRVDPAALDAFIAEGGTGEPGA